MSKTAPVVLVEDDQDDQDIFIECYKSLNYLNPLIVLQDGSEALDWLKQTEVTPLFILTDINLPRLNGLELRRRMLKEARRRIAYAPFVFYTTSDYQRMIDDAYELSIQGFFIKRINIEDIRKMVSILMDYWSNAAEIRYREDSNAG